jgi:uncharacterized protein YlzI (FlbEa/FlbD family)
MPNKFIELTRIENNEKILINVNHISKFYSDDKGTMIWIDGGYIIVKESYERIRHLLIHGLMSKYISVILNNNMEDDE